jgi:hypothetical protein
MSSIVLISSYCDTDRKSQVLHDNLKIMKSEGLEIALITPLQISPATASLCDYIFYTKENPVLKFPQKSMVYYQTFPDGDKIWCVQNALPDPGFASLNHIRRLGEIFSLHDYNQFHFVVYDILLDESTIQSLKTNGISMCYPHYRDGKIKYDLGAILISLTRNHLAEVLPLLTIENYLAVANRSIETFLFDVLHQKMEIPISVLPVSDLIFTEPDNPTNHSNIPSLFYSIILEYNSIENVRLFFHGRHQGEVRCEINGNTIFFFSNQPGVLDLGMAKSHINSAIIIYNEKYYDITNDIVNHVHSTLEII